MGPASPRLALFYACSGHALMHILTGLYLTVVLSLEQSWAVDYDTLISLWTVGSLMIGLGAPIAGWLGDRWSESRMMAVFFLVTGAGSIAAGLVDSQLAMMLALAVLGFGASIYHPVGMSWVVRNAVHRGRALGILGIAGGLGVALASLIAAVLTGLVSWRAAFLVPGVVTLGFGIALSWHIARGRVADRKVDVNPDTHRSTRGDMVRVFLILTLTMAMAGLSFNALQVAMPKWFELEMAGVVGDGILGIGGLVTAVYLVSAGAQMIGGILADRYSLRAVYLVGLLVYPVLLALASVLANVPLLLVVMIAVFVSSAATVAENLLLARYTPSGRRGLAYGLKFVLAFGVAPLGVQAVAFSYRLSGAFDLLLWGLAIGGLIAFAVAAMLPRRIGGPRVSAPALQPAE